MSITICYVTYVLLTTASNYALNNTHNLLQSLWHLSNWHFVGQVQKFPQNFWNTAGSSTFKEIFNLIRNCQNKTMAGYVARRGPMVFCKYSQLKSLGHLLRLHYTWNTVWWLRKHGTNVIPNQLQPAWANGLTICQDSISTVCITNKWLQIKF